METENRTPESLEEAKKRVFARIWTRFVEGSLWVKLSLGLLAAIIVLVLARSHFLGDLGYRFSKVLFPFQISVVDEELAIIPLTFNYQVADAHMGKRDGKLGETLRTGDHLFLTFKVGIACWVNVFCIDEKGVQSVFGQGLNPHWVEKGEPYTLDFKLNDTLGREVYYAVANRNRFSFEKDIKPFLTHRFPNLNSKGPAISEFDIELPSNFRKKWFFFEHVGQNTNEAPK